VVCRRGVRSPASGWCSRSDQGRGGRCPVPGEEDMVRVQVTNAASEPDGSRRGSWLRVPPQIGTAPQAAAGTFSTDEGDAHSTAQP